MAAGHSGTVLGAHDCASVRRIKEFMRAGKPGLLNAVQLALHVTLNPEKFATIPHSQLLLIEHDDMSKVIELLKDVSEDEWRNTELLGRLFDALRRMIARGSVEIILPKALTAQRMCDYMLRGKPFLPRHVASFLMGISQLITMGKSFDSDAGGISKECLFRLFYRFSAGAGTARDWAGVFSSMCYVLKDRWEPHDVHFMSHILRGIRGRPYLCEKDVRQIAAAIKTSVPPRYKDSMLATLSCDAAMTEPSHPSAVARFVPTTHGVMASSPLQVPAMAHTGFSLGRVAMAGPSYPSAAARSVVPVSVMAGSPLRGSAMTHTGFSLDRAAMARSPHAPAAARFLSPTGGVMASSPLRVPVTAHTGFSLGCAATMTGPSHASVATRFVPPTGCAAPGQLSGDPVSEEFDRIMRMPSADRKRLLTLLQLAETADSAAEKVLESPTPG